MSKDTIIGILTGGADKMTGRFCNTQVTSVTVCAGLFSLTRMERMYLSNTVAYPGILFGGGGSTNSVEDRGQRERGSGGW